MIKIIRQICIFQNIQFNTYFIFLGLIVPLTLVCSQPNAEPFTASEIISKKLNI